MGIVLSRLNDGLLVDVNPAMLRLVGCSREELIGRTSREVGIWVSPEDRDSIVEVIRTYGRVDSLELQFQKKSGETGRC
ncbi:MAG: hypothetical protein A4E57_03017 [Syntrophorhabdaceae bacterium PtaU1.Bin034]|nr:MAG: hypothetical protein A4E57_03017 [Syntrophorhabdaceae bacterium PtaU1.Bin034]